MHTIICRDTRRSPPTGRAAAPARGPRTAPGFSLVELIVVIVLLAVLSASAMSRYIGLRNEARHSTVGMTASSFRMAIILAHTACVVRDYAGRDDLPTFGAGNVDFTADCFPSSTNGNNTGNMNNARCVQVWEGLLLPAPTITPGAGGTTEYRAQGAGSICTYTYRADPARSFTYDAASGKVVLANP